LTDSERLNSMLENIDDKYNKTEGSFFYDAEMPVAIELNKADAKADTILDKGFVDTATGSDLERKVAQQGIYRKQATKSSGLVTIGGSVGALIKIGDKVASDTLSFKFTENNVIPISGIIDVNVECEQFGSTGNVPISAIKYFPTTLSGLTTVTNTLAFDNGYNAETDDSLRQRYYLKVQTPGTSGNKYHYLNWAKEITGVGDARVIPLWDGNGTVKVVIINSNKVGASTELINEVIAHIEENKPIGATVTVISAIEVSIDTYATLVIDTDNYTTEQAQTNIINNITKYLASIAFVEDYVSYAKTGNEIINADGVEDYSGLQINGGITNIAIGNEEVAVIGGVVFG